jgi:hypothetical protein
MDPLKALMRTDLKRLLTIDPADVLGSILRLNRTSRYNNRLDALRIAIAIADLRQRRGPVAERTSR